MRRGLIFVISALMIALTSLWGQRAAAQLELGEPQFDGPEGMMEDVMIEQGPPVGGMGRMEGMREAMPPPLIERLKLTDEQQTKLKDLRLGLAKDMARLQADLQIARLDLGAVLDQPSPKPEEAKAKAARVSEAEAAVLQRMVAFQVGLKSILTPDQQKMLQQERGMRMMRGMMRGPRGGPFFNRPSPRGGRRFNGPGPGGAPSPNPQNN